MAAMQITVIEDENCKVDQFAFMAWVESVCNSIMKESEHDAKEDNERGKVVK